MHENDFVSILRKCSSCLKDKDISEFPKDSSRLSGYRSQCKSCTYAARRVYFPPEKVAAYNKAYFATPVGKEAKSRGHKKWRESLKGKAFDQLPKEKERKRKKAARYRTNNPLKTAARSAVRAAKANKTILPACQQTCACGNKAAHYHHHLGYEPEHHLDVIPVCRACHRKLG